MGCALQLPDWLVIMCHLHQLCLSWRNWVHAWAFYLRGLERKKRKRVHWYLAFLLKHCASRRAEEFWFGIAHCTLLSRNLTMQPCYFTWETMNFGLSNRESRNICYQSYLQHIFPCTFNISWLTESPHYHSIHFWKLSTKGEGFVFAFEFLPM